MENCCLVWQQLLFDDGVREDRMIVPCCCPCCSINQSCFPVVVVPDPYCCIEGEVVSFVFTITAVITFPRCFTFDEEWHRAELNRAELGAGTIRLSFLSNFILKHQHYNITLRYNCKHYNITLQYFSINTISCVHIEKTSSFKWSLSCHLKHQHSSSLLLKSLASRIVWLY